MRGSGLHKGTDRTIRDGFKQRANHATTGTASSRMEAEVGIEPASTALQAVAHPYISISYTALPLVLPLHLFVLFQLPISS